MGEGGGGLINILKSITMCKNTSDITALGFHHFDASCKETCIICTNVCYCGIHFCNDFYGFFSSGKLYKTIGPAETGVGRAGTERGCLV